MCFYRLFNNPENNRVFIICKKSRLLKISGKAMYFINLYFYLTKKIPADVNKAEFPGFYSNILDNSIIGSYAG